MLIVRGVNVFPTQIEELILAQPLLAPHFRMVVGREGHLDTLEVLAELRVAGEHAGKAAMQGIDDEHMSGCRIGVGGGVLNPLGR